MTVHDDLRTVICAAIAHPGEGVRHGAFGVDGFFALPVRVKCKTCYTA
jgi:hypothetical protein